VRGDFDVFPLRERLRLRDSFGLALRELRQRPAFATLARGPWGLFIAIAVHWQGNPEAWPSQETLASFSGWSCRAVRDHVVTLERRGFVRLRRQRRGDGSERLFYAPGAVTVAELAAFVARYPREGGLRRPISPPPEATAGAPPEAIAGEPRDPDQREPSSCCEAHAVGSLPAERKQQQSIPCAEDEEVARLALVERMRRRYPARPTPDPAVWRFDAGDVAMVAACSAAIEGDREAKLAVHRAALTGAFAASKEGPPTVRFTWGTLEHFFDHVERGRRQLRAEEPERRPAQRRGREAPASLVDADRIQADRVRIFGPG
jgi:hypothetical protein